MPRPALLGALVLLTAVLGAGGARAQGTAPPRWELLGLQGENLKGLFFAHGPAPDGSDDALYAHGIRGLWRRAPSGAWSGDLHTPPGGADFADLTREGHLFVGAPAGATNVDRSTNGGQTWEQDVFDGVTTLYQSTLPALGGAVYGCAYRCHRSFDGGALGSWETLGNTGGEAITLGEVPVSPSLPEGRLLAGVWNGLAYSDDGGVTWAPTSLWAPGALVVNSLAFAPIAGHPYGGIAYAGALDLQFEERVSVFRSDDGGQTWTLARRFRNGDFGVATPHWAVVGVDERAGGALYAGIEQVVGGPPANLGTVVASFDGGQTWAAAADTARGWGGYAPRELGVGRDRRLYAATDAGVYRTVEGVPVSSEPGPEPGEETGVRLEVRPNPARGGAEVALVLPEAGAGWSLSEVEVSVYDVLGRRVAVLHEGPLAAGAHTLPFDGSSLPPGLYVVRASAGGAAVSRSVTLLR